jgi:rRNA maturation endonuclease Nob1
MTVKTGKGIMSDQIATPATPAPEQTAPTSTETVKTGGKVFTEAEVEQILRERLERERSKREAAAKEAVEKATAETAAKNGEWQKLAEQREAELSSLKAQLTQRQQADQKRAIAERVGLPASLASRLVGETDDDLEKDAKALLETLPKQQPPAPGLKPVNPGANGQAAETEAQRIARLKGSQPDFWRGGGVRWNNEQKG